MKKEEFLVALEDILQVDDPISENQNLDNFEEWDSLSKMATMAYFDKSFGIKLSLNDLKDINSVSDLIKLAGEHIND